MEDVRHKMRNVWTEVSRPDSCKSSSVMGTIHHKIVEIGSTIHSKFKLDNVHINRTDARHDICYFVFIFDFYTTMFHRFDGSDKLVRVIQSLHKELEDQM